MGKIGIMNYWNKIFGNSDELKNQHHYPKWNFKILLLKRLHRVSPKNVFGGNNFVKEKYSELLNVENEIQNFNRNDLIKVSEYKDNLFNELTVKDLKEVLKIKGLKVSGSKKELVERVILNFEQVEILNPKANYKRYILTEKGRNLINEDKERFKKELDKFQNEIFKLIYDFKFEDAFKSVSDFYALYPFPLGLNTDWKLGFSFVDKEQTKQLRNIELDFCKYSFTENILNSVRTELATYSLFKYDYFGKYEIEKKILNIAPQFECTLVNNFLENSPTGVFRKYDSSNNIKKLKIFVHYCINIVYNRANVKYSQEFKDNDLFKGVTLIPRGKDCIYCLNSSEQNYSWKELDEIPKIPKYPGCTCYYVSWIERK